MTTIEMIPALEHTTRQAALEVLAAFQAAWGKKDARGIVELTSWDPHLTVALASTGSVAHGRDELLEQLTRRFAKSDRTSLTTRSVHVDGRDEVAWICAELDLVEERDGKETTLPLRSTLVVAEEGGRWRIQAGHTSVEEGRDEE